MICWTEKSKHLSHKTNCLWKSLNFLIQSYILTTLVGYKRDESKWEAQIHLGSIWKWSTHMTAHQNETKPNDIWQCVSPLMYIQYKVKWSFIDFHESLCIFLSFGHLLWKKIYGGECSNFWYISSKPSKWLQSNENVERGKKLWAS